jgi:hypothetical protein
MADTEFGKRSHEDVALDLAEFVYSHIIGKPDAEDKLLALYEKCKAAVYAPIKR